MVYRIVAKRENETVRSERNSLLIAFSKARIWTSEGWDVVVADGDGTPVDPAEYDKFLAAWRSADARQLWRGLRLGHQNASDG